MDPGADALDLDRAIFVFIVEPVTCMVFDRFIGRAWVWTHQRV